MIHAALRCKVSFIENAKRAVRREKEEQQRLDEAAREQGNWQALYAEANAAMHYLNEEYVEETFVVDPDSEDGTAIKALLEPLSESVEPSLMQEEVIMESEAAIHQFLNQEDWEISESGEEQELQQEFSLYLQENFEQERTQEAVEPGEAVHVWAAPPQDKPEPLRRKGTKWP